MCKREILSLLLLFLLIEQAGWCCGGCGGFRNCTSHGKLTHRSYTSLLESQKAVVAETQAIDRYMKLGCQLEAKKRWADSEQSFHYVLQVISLHDAPGSFKSIPALGHLAAVSKAQNKLDQAISFQETALLLTKAQPNANQQAVLNAQVWLGDLYLKKQDYSHAEEVFSDMVDMYKTQPSLPREKRSVIFKCYARILRQLHKDSEADAIEAEADANNSQLAIEKQAESKQEALPDNANHPLSSAQSPVALN